MVNDNHACEWGGEEEAFWTLFDSTDYRVEDATVARLVVMYGVTYGEKDSEPCEKQEEGGGFESPVCGCGFGDLEGLFGGALHGDGFPVSRYGHEEALYKISALLYRIQEYAYYALTMKPNA